MWLRLTVPAEWDYGIVNSCVVIHQHKLVVLPSQFIIIISHPNQCHTQTWISLKSTTCQTTMIPQQGNLHSMNQPQRWLFKCLLFQNRTYHYLTLLSSHLHAKMHRQIHWSFKKNSLSASTAHQHNLQHSLYAPLVQDVASKHLTGMEVGYKLISLHHQAMLLHNIFWSTEDSGGDRA